MKNAFFILLFLIFGPQAWAQTAPPVPPVMPAQLGSSGSAFKAGYTDAGRWLAWRHTVSGVTTVYVVCAAYDYEIQHPDTTGMTPIRAARAYWLANVDRDCRTDPALRSLWATGYQAMRE